MAHYYEQLRRRGAPIARFGLGVRLSHGPEFDVLAQPLSTCSVPISLVLGAADRLVPPSTGRRFADLLPRAVFDDAVLLDHAQLLAELAARRLERYRLRPPAPTF